MTAAARADTEDWQQVSAVLGDAFTEDPVMRWLLPDPARRTGKLRRFFEVESRYDVLPHGVSLVAPGPDGPLGAALVMPPGHWRAPMLRQLAHAPALARVFGLGLVRALRMVGGMEGKHLREPHYYLPFVGVAPAAQGRGVGGGLLTALAERCDREGLPAYLEATSPRNATLYRRHGFVGTEIIRPAGSPPIELMLRAPRR